MSNGSALVLVRRSVIFTLALGGGTAVAAWLAGGLFISDRVDERYAGATQAAPIDHKRLMVIEGGGAIGPGVNGRMDHNAVAVAENKAIPYRAWTAYWKTSDPVAEKDHTLRTMRLGTARIVFFPEPERADRPPAAKEDAVGATVLTGDEAIFRQKEGGRPSAHFEGSAVARHQLDGGELLVLSSDVLEYAEEAAPPGKPAPRVIESDRKVRIDGGGSVITGVGMRAVLESGRKERIHLNRDVVGDFLPQPSRKPKTGTAPVAAPIRLRCDGAVDIEALDAPTGGKNEGRQPWRATFRDHAVFEHDGFVLTADQIVVDFIRTGAADQKAGAPPTDIVKFVATGHVVLRGADATSAYLINCERLRRFQEDGRTDVTIVDGQQTMVFDGIGKDGRATTTTLTGKGPTTIRQRRSAAARTSASKIAIVCEGDVVVVERDAAEKVPISEFRAPRVTIEGRQAAAAAGSSSQPIEPTLLRGEQGAELRRQELYAKGKTIVWTAATAAAGAASGAREHIAIVGDPLLSYPDKEGLNPFDEKGQAKPGVVEIRAGDRIDADLAPPPPGSKRRSGAHAITCAGGTTMKKLVDGEPTMELTAATGSAQLDSFGRLKELRAIGNAHIFGHGESTGARAGDFQGDDIVVLRTAPGFAAAGAEAAPLDMDIFIRTTGPLPALAVLENGVQRHEVRGRELRSLGGGAVIQALGNASADIDLPRDAPAPQRGARPAPPVDPTMAAEAQELKIECDPGVKGKSKVHLVHGSGDVSLRSGTYKMLGDQATYDAITGKASVAGNPARLIRTEDKEAPSTVVGPVVNGQFDAGVPGRDSFQRGLMSQGGTLVVYSKGDGQTRERITITSKGPFDVQRTFAAATQDVVVVMEKRLPNGNWHLDTRLDHCRRVDVTFEPEVKGKASELIRTLIAIGAPAHRAGAQVTTRSPDGLRVTRAVAERIEIAPQRSVLFLSCPSGESRVFVDEQSVGRRYECDQATFEYDAHTWESVRQTAVQE